MTVDLYLPDDPHKAYELGSEHARYQTAAKFDDLRMHLECAAGHMDDFGRSNDANDLECATIDIAESLKIVARLQGKDL